MDRIAELEKCRSNRRASTLVFLLVITACSSIALMALISLSAQVYLSVARDEQRTRAELAMQGAVANIRSQAYSGTLTVPSTQTITIDNFDCVTTVSSNGASVANSYEIDVSTSRWGRTYSISRITGLPNGAANSIYKYALAMNGASTMSSTLTTRDASNRADVYSKGAINFGVFGSVIQGDADLTTPTTGKTVTVNGTRTTNYPARTWPAPVDATYSAAADYNFGNHSVGSISFPSANTLVYIGGTMTFNGGTVSGTGTYYVTGNATISGDITYSNGSAKLVIICKGTLTFSANSNVAAIVFANNVSWGSGCTITKGLLCVGNATTFSNALDITFDPAIMNGGTLGNSMYLPGLWP